MDYNNIKTISANESKLLKTLEEEGRSWARVSEIYPYYPAQTQTSVRTMLQRMVKKGLLAKYGKDLLWVVPLNQDANAFLPDWHLMAEALAHGDKYYVGYYSALQLHGLITQPSLKEQIVCASTNSKVINLCGVDFQIIKHNPSHFFGTKKIWIDSFNKVVCSDLEKTIIDCLFKPEYAGGIVEIAKAMWTARDRFDYGRMLKYSEQFGSQAVVKRLGYLMESLNIGESIIPELLQQRSSSVSPLDTDAPAEGKITTRWNLLINVDMPTIKNSIEN